MSHIAIALLTLAFVPPASPGSVRTHAVASPYQTGKTHIRVLLPDDLKPGQRYPVVYLLPVEAGDGNRYGDGLLEAKKTDVHNKHSLICVAPTFSHLPWYADHPTDAGIRQESHFVKVVVPFVERTYPVIANSSGRRLLGFSKSGWGAYSLLLRHPKTFGKAAAWDAPMLMTWPSKYGSKTIFGTRENFDRYRIAGLLKSRAKELRNKTRLVLTGYGNETFRGQHEELHRLMTKLKIRHHYRDGPKRRHHWNSGWLAQAVSLLLEDDQAGKLASLFDGKTLTGWKAVPAKTASDWSVKDGAIVGVGSANRQSYLVWKETDLTDFELRFRYRLPTNGNTGVEIRAQPDATGKRPFQGYHADLGHVGIGRNVLGAWDFHFAKRKEYPCPRGTRLVIDADGTAKSSKIPNALKLSDVKKRDWNDVRVIARGRRFQFFINGKLTSEFTDNARSGRLDKGAIGLQLHDKGMRVEFKDLRLRKLRK